MEIRDLIIIGSGPSGLTAAIYAARANLNPLMIEGAAPGGQLMTTTEVENYPGFADGILGPELMDQFRKQAQRFNTEFITDDVTEVDLTGKIKKVFVGETLYQARSIIISTGAKSKMIGLESERKLLGYGVSTCATCDGFFFSGHEIAVVGGGDSAMEEALFLSRFANKVTLIHRRDEFRASKIMQDRVLANEKVELRLNSQVIEVNGDVKVSSLTLKDTITGEESQLDVTGLFVAIGHTPNTSLFKDQIELDDMDYILTNGHSTKTNLDGVYAAGDVADHVYRQAITAAGTGAMAAIEVERFLETLK
ncbi:MAG: thioredoxin-disulfide reductase [Acidimicrobiia bacterium]|nr:thioredoxin-disulfide reductase [Acidimicrobiia bacterium]